MCPSAPRVCSESGDQKPVLSLSLDLIGGSTPSPGHITHMWGQYNGVIFWEFKLYIYIYIFMFLIQIKICAEYRDMLPRPRLVCQEPGLRPIGRSPGVPDKSSRGLGSMSRYSAQILICFIAYIFSISLWVWLGTLQNCHHAQCPLPLFIVIRMRLLSAHQTIKSPSMPCWGAAGRNTLWHSCHRTGEISR